MKRCTEIGDPLKEAALVVVAPSGAQLAGKITLFPRPLDLKGAWPVAEIAYVTSPPLSPSPSNPQAIPIDAKIASSSGSGEAVIPVRTDTPSPARASREELINY